MKKRLIILFLVLAGNLSSQTKGYLYLSPVPGSKYHNPETNIIIKPEVFPSFAELNSSDYISVSGAGSGKVTGKINYSANDNYIIFTPDKHFELGETVTVNIGGTRNPYSYTFEIKKIKPNITFNSFQSEIGTINPEPSDQLFGITLADSLPSDMPRVTVLTNINPSNGKIFISPMRVIGNYSPYIQIVNNDGSYFFYRKMSNNAYDFKLQPTGLLTYADYIKKKFYGLDSNYNLVDSFYCGNGYTTDEHELRILPNGNFFLLSYDPQIVDMSVIVPGGDTAATVIGLIVQELNPQKQVIFQWRSWDHFEITDATQISLTAKTIDYVHGNAIEIDNDQNIMISSRHIKEITKIDRTTGAIIWRLGGKNNQFEFINDPIGFSYQHSIRRVSGNNIILFDNGNYHSSSFSRAIEYSLDEVNKKVTLVWEYRSTPNIFSAAMGNVQRLSNGNTIIGWGTRANPSVTEVNPSGQKVYEIRNPNMVFSYRAQRFLWKDVLTGTGKESEIIEGYKLEQNFPNPFNPVTNIKFQIENPGMVTLKVFDLLGREVITLVNEMLQPGKYETTFDAGNLSSGIYFYSLETNNIKITKKCMLLK